MRGPISRSRTLARLIGVTAIVAVAVSGLLLVTVEDRIYGGAGLMISIGLAGGFFVLELFHFRSLNWSQALATLRGLREPREPREPAEAGLTLLLDPETTLSRTWLFSVRVTEEVERAHRYGRALALCLLEPEDRTLLLDEDFRSRVGRAVRGHLRSSDFATLDRGGRLLVLLPEATIPAVREAAGRLVTRLNSQLFEGKPRRWRGAFAYYPKDGTNAERLLETVYSGLAQSPAA